MLQKPETENSYLIIKDSQKDKKGYCLFFINILKKHCAIAMGAHFVRRLCPAEGAGAGTFAPFAKEIWHRRRQEAVHALGRA